MMEPFTLEQDVPMKETVKREMRRFVKYGVVSVLVACCSARAGAETIGHFVSELKKGQVSLEMLVALKTLESNEDHIGYGLCMVAKRQECARDGSLGYGLCMAAGRKGCVENSSLGYGVCMAGNRSGCDVQGNLGYGLCMAANRSGCKSDL
ncbi:MAG: hypothetical protein P8176_15875 [Gammaproteobacteria bacterium]